MKRREGPHLDGWHHRTGEETLEGHMNKEESDQIETEKAVGRSVLN